MTYIFVLYMFVCLSTILDHVFLTFTDCLTTFVFLCSPEHHSIITTFLCVYFSTCTDGMWDCGDTECSENVQCPNNQVYRHDMTTCDKSCMSINDAHTCDADVMLAMSGCGCPDNLLLNPDVR